MRPLALYLPQFHSFKENDEWWGSGYTEWTAVRRAKPLFSGHAEPREPYDGDHYDLSDPAGTRLSIQADMAREYGIYGFVFYQYYFTGHKLMERPMEILLSHPEIDLRYCICWANETWTRAWYDKQEEVLMKQEYGGEAEWKAHFEELLPFFKDERYIKCEGRPMLCIYRTFDIDELASMRKCFDRWAVEAGFEGIYLVGGKTAGETDDRGICDARYYFEPGYSLKHGLPPLRSLSYKLSTGSRHLYNKIFGKEILERRIPIEWIYSSISDRDYAENEFPGIVARWDNTPRRGYKGLVYTGASPAGFKETLCKLDKVVPSDRFVFINAWNEWGEGAMLEPDKAEGFGYLEAVRDVCGGSDDQREQENHGDRGDRGNQGDLGDQGE
ncbi:MAG: glycoside hydrolase family 99-like domain-containing protein [Lachnospiraceae bacterium]|nr:glycoside hydrolase family 99-like domain-containing protein [Lachnospiraceae bacterium]